jgi:AraC-like DNA-binding protein
MKIPSSEAVSNEHIRLNSCGCQHLAGKDLSISRPVGRVDYHILYIAKGVCYPTVGGRKRQATEGSLIFFFPGEPQYYAFAADTPTVSYYLHFSGTSPRELLREIEESGERVFYIGKSATLEELLCRTEEEYRLSLPYAEGVTGGYLSAVLSLCLRKIRLVSEGRTQATGKIAEACRTMLATLAEEHPVAYYAALAHLSESRFSHLFREVMGKSPLSYLSEARLRRAEELLSDTPLSVADVAEAVGIKNPYYFSRFFKKHTGLAPSDYRERKRKG